VILGLLYSSYLKKKKTLVFSGKTNGSRVSTKPSDFGNLF